MKVLSFTLLLSFVTRVNSIVQSLPQLKALSSTVMTVSVDETTRSLTDYEKLLRKIYFTRNAKNGLQNMIELNDALGKPLNNPNISVIHVAGTNGKGSVCLKIAKVLELAGHKVGLFTSPHMSSYRERISINGELISEEEVQMYLEQVLNTCDQSNIQATFFEITVGLAFRYFSESSVDVVVLETGLGGLTDATNVITAPVLSIVTSIGLEHTALLGDTIELIGAQKAGIIKKGCPALVGPNVPHEVIREYAKEIGAEGYYTCDDILGPVAQNECKKSMNGVDYVDYDVENSRTARAAIALLQQKRKSNVFPTPNLTEENIFGGISQRPSCRFEEIKIDDSLSILDVAHNPPAMTTLVAKLQATYPDKVKRFVVGFSADKDIATIASLLLSVVPSPRNIHLVDTVSRHAATIEDIVKAAPRLAEANNIETERTIAAQVRTAKQLAEENNEVLVICGSVFLMSEARLALGIKDARDSNRIMTG